MRGQTVEDLITELQALPAHMRRAPVDLCVLGGSADDASIGIDFNQGTVQLQQSHEYVQKPYPFEYDSDALIESLDILDKVGETAKQTSYLKGLRAATEFLRSWLKGEDPLPPKAKP